jgi:hypothetical protein
MKRVKKDAASFKQLGTAQMGKIKGGETVEVIDANGKKIIITY